MAIPKPLNTAARRHAARKAGDPTLIVPLTIAVWHEDDRWLSECLELGIGTFGADPDDAAEQAMDAVCSYLNTIDELGERERIFAEKSIQVIVAPAAEWRLDVPGNVASRKDLQLRPFEFPLTYA